MYVCICNAIREADFRKAVLEHEGDVEDIYAIMGFETQCGQCVNPARRILIQERAKLEEAAAHDREIRDKST